MNNIKTIIIHARNAILGYFHMICHGHAGQSALRKLLSTIHVFDAAVNKDWHDYLLVNFKV